METKVYNNTSGPVVSVLITAYNREAFLAEAISSVLASSYQNLEIIIVDDASKDNTAAIAKSFGANDQRIKVFVNEQNLGDYPNRNKAASYATGEYLMYVDSDDLIYKESIGKAVSLMMANPKANFGTYYRLPATEPFVWDAATALRKHFLEAPYLMIGPGGIIIRREYFNFIGGFPEKYGPANDMYFNLKAARYSDTLMIPFEFHFIRKHAGQEINNRFSYLYNNYCYNRDSFNELDLPLDASTILLLHKKNKRRFVVNLCKYFSKSFNISKTLYAVKQASFTPKDAIEGIFH